jgi:hypothetical protein
MLFAYVVNEIGYCISSLRKEKEVIEKDLSVIEKMRKHYNMEKDLANRVREYVVNDAARGNQLTPDEERHISVKLTEELREGKPDLMQS